MKSEDIKVGHIYYVDFDPVMRGEFGKKHLAVVIKKNLDKITFVSIPLTSKEKGTGTNKVALGKLTCLPKSLSQKESFAVIDQVRTVNASRFYALLENGEEWDSIFEDDLLVKIYKAIIKNLLRDVTKENMIKIFSD